MCDSHKARRRRYEVIFRSCCETNSFSSICPFSSHFPLCTLTAFKQFIAKKKRCMQVLDVTEKKCQVRLFLKKRSEYLLEDLWEEKKVQGLVRSQPAFIYLSNIFPKLLFLCVCRFDRRSFCFISWFCLKTRSRVQRPDQRWSLSALHTAISFLVTNVRSCTGGFSIQMSDQRWKLQNAVQCSNCMEID